MSAELRFSTLAGLVAGMSVATAAFSDPLPLWMPIPLILFALWRLVPAWRGSAPPPLERSWKLLALAVLILLLWGSGRLGLGINGAGALFIVLLWSKLLELQDLRDLHATCAIALFVVAAQLLISQSLGQCLIAALASIMLLAVLVHAYVVGLADGAAAAATVPASRQLQLWWRVLRQTGWICLQAAPFGVVLFMCVPRPAMNPGLDTRNQMSGVSDRLDPGSISDLALNQSVAFRVDFLGAVRPDPSSCYWRGLVLWHCNGQSWGRTGRYAQSMIAADQNQEKRTNPAHHRHTIDYDVYMEPTNRKWVFTLDCPADRPDAVTNPQGLETTYERSLGCVWMSKEVVGSVRHYRAISDDEPANDPAAGNFLKSNYGVTTELGDIPDYTQMPDRFDERTRLYKPFYELADKLRSQCLVHQRTRHGVPDDEVDAAKAINATLGWFRHNNFRYTLHPGAMLSIDRTFLFERKRGFCEHFAAAFSMLMRAMGVPARVVVGYQGGEWNPVGNFLTVRQSNAHAWSEVYIAGEGWRRVDPTSAVVAEDDDGNLLPEGVGGDTGALLGANGGSFFARHMRYLSQRWDYIEAMWDRWALSYDQDTMGALEHALGLDRLGLFAPVIMFLVPTTPILLVLLVLLRRRRALGDPALQAYRRLCDRLALAGVPRHPDEGPIDFATRAGLSFPAWAESIRDSAARYARLRYGPPLDPARRSREIAELVRQVGALRLRRTPASLPR